MFFRIYCREFLLNDCPLTPAANDSKAWRSEGRKSIIIVLAVICAENFNKLMSCFVLDVSLTPPLMFWALPKPGIFSTKAKSKNENSTFKTKPFSTVFNTT